MSRLALLTLGAGAVLLVACDVPTETPRLEQEWQVTVDSVGIGVGDFLPAAIRFNADSTALLLDYDGASASASLAEMCGAGCSGIPGATIPAKPAFQDTLTAVTTLAADLVSARVAAAPVDVELTHTLEFDPLSPAGASEHGFIVVRGTSGGVVVAEDSIDGASVPFTSADTLRLELDVEPVDITNTVHVEVIVYSPAGGATTVDADDALRVRVAPGTLVLSSVTVAVGTRSFGPETETLELNVDPTVVDHIQSGGLILDIENPLSVAGSMTLDFDLGTRTIRKTVQFVEGSQEVRVDFSTDELHSLLATPEVRIVANGTATSSDGTVTIEPSDRIVVRIQVEAVLLVGSTAGGA